MGYRCDVRIRDHFVRATMREGLDARDRIGACRSDTRLRVRARRMRAIPGTVAPRSSFLSSVITGANSQGNTRTPFLTAQEVTCCGTASRYCGTAFSPLLHTRARQRIERSDQATRDVSRRLLVHARWNIVCPPTIHVQPGCRIIQ